MSRSRAWRRKAVSPGVTRPSIRTAVADSGDEFDRARQQFFQQGATVKVKQHAYYIQDSWNITDNFIAYLGVRWDTFENLNGDGETYVKISNQFGPRLGFSWDVFGDSTFKVFGNAGRYALPLTPSVAVRGASASLFSRESFDFDQTVDPITGAPNNPIARPGTFIYLNSEDGTPKNPLTIASKNLDPMYQDEYILGFQKMLTDHLSLGIRGIYRELKQAIDDNCDYSACSTRRLRSHLRRCRRFPRLLECVRRLRIAAEPRLPVLPHVQPGQGRGVRDRPARQRHLTTNDHPGFAPVPAGQAQLLGDGILRRRQLGQVLPARFVHLRQVDRQHRRRREVRHRPERHRASRRTSTTSS